jgi:hypothetical protein
MINKWSFANYFCSTEESSESSPIVNRLELDHLHLVSSVDQECWRTLDPAQARFKEADAYWLFFSAVTKYYQKTTPIDEDGEPRITVNQ